MERLNCGQKTKRVIVYIGYMEWAGVLVQCVILTGKSGIKALPSLAGLHHCVSCALCYSYGHSTPTSFFVLAARWPIAEPSKVDNLQETLRLVNGRQAQAKRLYVYIARNGKIKNKWSAWFSTIGWSSLSRCLCIVLFLRENQEGKVFQRDFQPLLNNSNFLLISFIFNIVLIYKSPAAYILYICFQYPDRR